MSLITIIKIIYLSYNKDEFKRLLFAAIGILLGGALFTSVRISTENIELSLASSENYLSRNVIHIRSNTGFIPESLVKQIAFVPGVKSVTPVNEKFIKGYIGKQSIGAVQIIGIDIIKILDFAGTKENKKSISSLSNYLKYYSKDPIYVLASQKLYNQAHDVPLDLEINGKLVKVQIGGVIPSSIESKVDENKIIIDINNFQHIFNQQGYVEELNLLTFGVSDDAIVKKISALLPDTVQVYDKKNNSTYAKDVTAAFIFNLNFLVILASLVTSVMVYNSISRYILDRRNEFGILMMLGARPIKLIIAILLANSVIALFCGALGILLGYQLSKIIVSMVTTSLSNIYFPVTVSQIYLPLYTALQILVLTILIALITSAIACYGIYNIPLRKTVFYQTYEQEFKKQINYITLFGVFLLGISLACTTQFVLQYNNKIAFLALIGIMLSVAFFQPMMLSSFLRLAELTIGKYFMPLNFAAEHIRTTMRKNVLAISAMSMAVALSAICYIIIDSSRQNVLDWVDQTNSADIYIKSSDINVIDQYLPEEVIAYAKSLPEVNAYNLTAYKDISYKNVPIRVEGGDINTLVAHGAIQFQHSMNAEKLQAILSDARNILISDRAAKKLDLKVGDTFSIPGNHGVYHAKVAGIYYNHSSDRNFILLENKVFSSLYSQPKAQSMMLFLNDPKKTNDVAQSLKNKFQKYTLLVQSNHQVKELSKSIVKQAFKVGDVILIITLMTSIITLFITLEELILSRLNELTIFWAIGATDKQIVKMCLWESLLICAAAVINAVIPTMIVIYIIFFYMNELFFGTTIVLHIPYLLGIAFIAFLFVLAVIAGLLPAIKMKPLINSQRLRYE